MDAKESDWYCARFDRTPDLALLAKYRQLLGHVVPMFVVREGLSGGMALYLPPGAPRAVRAINSDTSLTPFEPCAKPQDSVTVNILFGDDSDLERYFPEVAARGGRGDRIV